LHRPKFAPYTESESLRAFLRKVFHSAEPISIPSPIRACRDPRDDKFLSLAVHGHADVLITGDDDLLALHPFQGVTILTPADFLAR
jgi:putative PIN family toxin of toxin-antitoxin system